MKRKSLYILMISLLVLGLALSACKKSKPKPTEEPTPPATATVKPTATAGPPTPTPTPLPDYQPLPPGSIPPFVIQRSPERGEELNLDQPVELIFDRPMDRESVQEALVVSVDGGETVEGDFEWVSDRAVRFKPKGLARGVRYHVYLGQGAKGQEGTSLDGAYRFKFNTTGFLEVTQVVPADGSTDVESDGIITVMFNRPVVPLTAISTPGADLPDPLTFDPPIEGTGEWLNTSIYLFAPSEPLAGGTTYTARVKAGLTDTTGGLLAEDHVWQFTTFPPEVVWVTPYEDQELVSPDTAITVQFNQQVDAASAMESFRIFPQGGDDVSGKFEHAGDTLVFTPTEMLEFDTDYLVEVAAGVQSVSGGEGMRSDFRWSFETVPYPRILYTEPSNGDTSAYPYTDFRIEFNAPIDPATVMPNLEMTPPLSPALVYTYSWGTSFVLYFGAQPDTDYEVRLGPDIADPYGNTIGEGMTVRFHTRNLEPMAYLHVPDRVGTYDANQPARLFVAHRNVDRLDFDLYRLSLDQFFEAMDDWWDFDPSGDPLREWSESVSAPKNETDYAAVDLVENRGTLSPGIYFLEVSGPGVDFDRWGHRHILVVSQINLTLKVNQDEALVWATDLSTGAPVSGLTLSARTEEGKRFDPATTDRDGLARFSLESDPYRYGLYVYSEEPFVLASEYWNPGISVWEFGFEGSYEEAGYRSHIYTDRPIYRPGQTVYFRGVIRAEDDVKYRLPGLRRVRVHIYDAAYEELFNEELDLDEFGAFHGEIELAEGASLGYYRIQIEAADGSTELAEVLYAEVSFQVAAYRPPEFEVSATPDEPELLQGQSSQITVDVSYFFGGPVADVSIEWNVLAESYTFEPFQFGRYSFSDVDDPWICRRCWWWRPEPAYEPILSGYGETNQDGKLVIELPSDIYTLGLGEDDEPEFVGGRRLTIEATAYGRDGQVISGRGQIIIHAGEFYVGLAPQQYVGEAGEEMAVNVVTTDWDGERWPNQELDYQVYLREWVNTFVEDEAGGGYWEWETRETLVDEGELNTDENAEAVVSFTPDQGGSYHVVVSGRDSGERLVRSSIFVWVSGSEYVSWRRENNDRITLISDKTVYAPGETAEILIPSPFEGDQWMWVTVERGGVLQQEVVRPESNSYVYRLPITADHAPNVYVSVVIVQGREPNGRLADYKVGYVGLEVSTEQQELTVTLTPSADQAGPGETVTFQVQASDYAGEPVSAEFSLDLVDKAVLSLSPRTPDAIVNAFYGRRGLGVSTASGLSVSVNRLLLEELEEYDQAVAQERAAVNGEVAPGAPPPAPEPTMAAMDMLEAPAEEAEAGFAAKGAAAPPPGVELREEFADTAYWRADVVTDREGRATVEIKLPDNLTTWVMRGVGATVETLVGEATSEVVATKPLLIRPVAPRFFVVGDHVQLAANVSNNTDEDQDVTVAVDAVGLTFDQSTSSQVTIPAHSEAKVTWWVSVEDVPNVDLIFSAVSDEYSDAARPRLTTGPEGTLKVFRYTAPEVVGTGGQLVTGDSRVEAIAMPPKYDDRRGELSIQLAPSLAAGMRDGLDYLEHFEYECTEQTVSRFLPNVLTYRALKDLGVVDPELEAKLPGLVDEGLTRLYLQQRYDGGWGWWYDDDSSPYLTSYVIFALVKAQDAGFEVRQDVIQRGLGFLNDQLVPTRNLNATREANRQAWILYVMAEAGEHSRVSEWVDSLYESREKLSHYSRAYLALTLDLLEPGDARIQTLLADLNNDAILSATGAHWEESYYDWWAMNTDTRSTAIVLDALTKLDPDNALVPNVVRWLMIARKDGIWETTQETAWSLIALTDWMVHTGELEGQYEYGVSLNGALLGDGQVTPENVDESIKLRVDVADLLADVTNQLVISRGDGPGRLYYTAHLKVYLPVEEIEPLDRGIIVDRQYTLASCVPTEEAPCPEVSQVQVGDVVQVKLTLIAPNSLYYLVVEDMLPAGAEAIDTSLETTSLLERSPSLRRQVDRGGFWYDFYWWWWHWYSRSELRDEKVVLFADYLAAGTYEYTYTFRAVLPGEYQVIPTFANEFYFPEVFGRGEGELFVIKE